MIDWLIFLREKNEGGEGEVPDMLSLTVPPTEMLTAM